MCAGGRECVKGDPVGGTRHNVSIEDGIQANGILHKHEQCKDPERALVSAIPTVGLRSARPTHGQRTEDDHLRIQRIDQQSQPLPHASPASFATVRASASPDSHHLHQSSARRLQRPSQRPPGIALQTVRTKNRPLGKFSGSGDTQRFVRCGGEKLRVAYSNPAAVHNFNARWHWNSIASLSLRH
jgi:hypothetical protein